MKPAARKLDHADRKVTQAATAKRDTPIVRALGQLSEVGDQPPLRVLSLGTIAIGLWRRDRRLAVAGARMLAAHTLATWLKTRIKRRVDRTRPDHALEAGYRIEAGDSDEHALSSFPSGHTAGAVAVAQALARDYPAAAGPARVAAAAIAIVQVPRAKHFVGDVVAGAIVGLVAERVASAVVDRLTAPPAPPPPAVAEFTVALPAYSGLRVAP